MYYSTSIVYAQLRQCENRTRNFSTSVSVSYYIRDSKDYFLIHVKSDENQSIRGKGKKRRPIQDVSAQCYTPQEGYLLMLMRHFKQRLTFLFTEGYFTPKCDMIWHGGHSDSLL